ncbi:InlB B-repeat-containing protein, partial [Candidatus Saccharibacteria bacterium]|nr:InlB B-repeat-containing protein [Candidatus Saccharibacteria bacterium]
MKHFKAVASSAVVGLSVLAFGSALFGFSFARTPGTGEKIYGQDAFSQEYSRGVVFWSEGRSNMTKEFSKPLSDTVCPNGITPGGTDVAKEAFCYNNHAEKADVYYIVRNGAVMNNQPLDVQVYPWVQLNDGDDVDKGFWGTYTNSGEGDTNVAGISFPSHAQTGVYNITTGTTTTRIIHLKIRFYKAGTAGTSNAEEVSFKGVIGTTDLDTLEGLNIVQGYHQGFVNDDTDLAFDGLHTWAGTTGTQGKTIFRAEVESNHEYPLKVDYIVRTGLGTHFWANSNTVNYNISDAPQGVTTPGSDIVAKYGTYAPSSVSAVDGYTFDGWYLDENMTEKAGTTIMVSSDTTLYGKFTQNMNTVSYVVTGAPEGYTKPANTTVAQYSSYNPVAA